VTAKPASPKPAAPRPAAAAPPPAPKSARARLSFKEQHALKTLPARMETLSAGVARLRAILSEPTLYARDRAGFERHSASLAAAEADLAAAEDEWLALELRREEIAAEGDS
jgi:ATP-binding cassette subfamily F protein uup